MRGNPLAVALAGALCVFTCASAAQGRKPLALNAGISVVHDSNFFRLAPDADAQAILGSGSRADTYFSLSAGLAADSGDGPSRLSVSGAIQSVMFSRFGQLDYTSLDLRARGDWRLTETLAADGQYSHGESLARFADFRTPVRNVRKIDEFKLGLRRGLREAVQLRGSLGLLRLDNSFEGSRDGDRADWYTELGPAFISRANSTLWLRWRHTGGEFPNRQVVAGSLVDNSFDQDDAGVFVDWRGSRLHQTVGRLDYTRRRHAQLGRRDFSGVTAAVNHDWHTSGKTIVSLGLRREIGATDDVVANYVLTDALSVAPLWNVSSKLQLVSKLEWRKRRFRGDPNFVINNRAPRQDNDSHYALSANYAWRDNARLELRLSREQRDSDFFGLDYRASEIVVSGRFEY